MAWSRGHLARSTASSKSILPCANFDSTYESVTKDWYFDSAITRAIRVDIGYMLWVMKEVDHADTLLKEMTIRYRRK